MSTYNGKPRLLSGNEAIAEGALAAGATFFAGYPITPSTEVAECMSVELPKRGGAFIQMEDEIASLGAVIGASLTGAKAFTATSGPGFSLMQEHVGYAAMAEVPCVIINVMRGGPSTGLPTKASQADIMQAKYGSHGDYPTVVLMPNSVLEAFELTVQAFNIAEKFRVPVILLADEIVGHMREKVVLPDPACLTVTDRLEPTTPPEWFKPYPNTATGISPMAAFGGPYRFHVTGLAHDTQGFPTARPEEVHALMTKFKNKEIKNIKELTSVEALAMEDAEFCILAVGSVSRSARRAVKILRANNIKVGLLRPRIIWPFPKIAVEEMLDQVELVLVPEMNVGQIRKEVERLASATAGKIHGLNVLHSEMISAEQIMEKILKLTMQTLTSH